MFQSTVTLTGTTSVSVAPGEITSSVAPLRRELSGLSHSVPIGATNHVMRSNIPSLSKQPSMKPNLVRNPSWTLQDCAQSPLCFMDSKILRSQKTFATKSQCLKNTTELQVFSTTISHKTSTRCTQRSRENPTLRSEARTKDAFTQEKTSTTTITTVNNEVGTNGNKSLSK